MVVQLHQLLSQPLGKLVLLYYLFMMGLLGKCVVDLTMFQEKLLLVMLNQIQQILALKFELRFKVIAYG